MKCYFHPEREATHTDSVVDLDGRASGNWPHEVTYKRVPICESCAMERKLWNTSRVEEVEGARGEMI